MTIQKIDLWVCDIQSPACQSERIEDTYGEVPSVRLDPEMPEGWMVLPQGLHNCDRCIDYYRLQSYPVKTIVASETTDCRWMRYPEGWHRLTDNHHGTYTGFSSAQLVGYDYQKED